jgi:uncharacterized membrane protein
MTQETHPIVDLTQADLDAMLQRALRNTLILGIVASLIVWIGGGWRSAAMLGTGTLISAVSIWEWQRLIRLINARLDKQKTPASAPVVVLFFVLRLTVFAGVTSLWPEPCSAGHCLGSDPVAARVIETGTETRLKQAPRRMRSAARRRKDSRIHAGNIHTCTLAGCPVEGR